MGILQEVVSQLTGESKWQKRKREYRLYITGDKWKSKRQQWFDQFGKYCRKCGYNPEKKRRRGRWIELHHVTYERFGDERLEDLTALCNHCHKKVERIKKRGRKRRR